MNQQWVKLNQFDGIVTGWLARNSVNLLRISLGLVFLGFGVLKFFPGVSPAQHMAEETVSALTFGLIPDRMGVVLVATLETTIGLSLIVCRLLRLGVALLGVAMIGILSPLVIVSDELFIHPYQPTIEGQYVIKDLVLLAAGLVVASSLKHRQRLTEGTEPAARPALPRLASESWDRTRDTRHGQIPSTLVAGDRVSR